MKKIILAILTVFLGQNLTFAINWVEVITPLNRIAYIDKDSITEYKNFYFYNIKFQNQAGGEYVILTVQSAKSSPLSARLKTYTLEEYNSLNGDYKNITENISQKLEPVTYQSVVNTCYKEVKRIKATEIANSIILNDEIIEE